MSIIQDALKKANNTTPKPEIKHEKKLTPIPLDVKKLAPEKKIAGPKHVYYLMIGFLLILLLGIIMIVSRSSQSAVMPVPAKKTETVILPKIERREEPVSSLRKREGISGFVLNGIMQLVDGPRAIINDIVVGEGETVNGAKVEKIKKDSVLLNYNDSEVTLNIK